MCVGPRLSPKRLWWPCLCCFWACGPSVETSKFPNKKTQNSPQQHLSPHQHTSPPTSPQPYHWYCAKFTGREVQILPKFNQPHDTVPDPLAHKRQTFPKPVSPTLWYCARFTGTKGQTFPKPDIIKAALPPKSVSQGGTASQRTHTQTGLLKEQRWSEPISCISKLTINGITRNIAYLSPPEPAETQKTQQRQRSPTTDYPVATEITNTSQKTSPANVSLLIQWVCTSHEFQVPTFWLHNTPTIATWLWATSNTAIVYTISSVWWSDRHIKYRATAETMKTGSTIHLPSQVPSQQEPEN